MFIILFILTTLLFSQEIDPDPWGGYSVSNSENFDTFTFNPAGIGIDHGNQIAYYLAPDNNGKLSKNSAFHYSERTNGFGYSLKYNKGDKLFNATDVNISFAGQINRPMSFGANWSKENKRISTGLLYRPANFLSFGIVSHFDEKLKDFEHKNESQ